VAFEQEEDVLMSNYLEMWERIKELDPIKTQRWISTLEPAKGERVYFRDIWVLDVDLLEALKSYRDDYKSSPPNEPNKLAPDYQWAPTIPDNDRDSLRTAIFQAIGSGSMCWENIDKAGVFLSDDAMRIGDGLHKWIRERYVREVDES